MERAFEMCVNKRKGITHIVLINVLVWHLQPNALSRQKLPLDIMFLKKQLEKNVKEGDSVRVDLESKKVSKNVDPYACEIRAKNQ